MGPQPQSAHGVRGRRRLAARSRARRGGDRRGRETRARVRSRVGRDAAAHLLEGRALGLRGLSQGPIIGGREERLLR